LLYYIILYYIILYYIILYYKSTYLYNQLLVISHKRLTVHGHESFSSNSYICMYTAVLANSAASHLYLRHDFYTVILKVKYELYIGSGSPSTPRKKLFCYAPGCRTLNYISTYYVDKDQILQESRAMLQANVCLSQTA